MKKHNRNLIFPLIFMGIVLVLISNCRSDDPIDTGDFRDYTTVERTIVPNTISPFPPQIYPCDIAKYPDYGYGGWRYGGGLAYQKRLDLMTAGYSGSSVKKEANLLRFSLCPTFILLMKRALHRPSITHIRAVVLHLDIRHLCY